MRLNTLDQQFEWHNPSEIVQAAEGLHLLALPHSDLFIDPGQGNTKNDAAFLYTELAGDFVLSALVAHDFASIYDAGALLVMESDTLWGKLAFEATDFGTHAVVSVVARGSSDDANGPNIAEKQVWLQLARVGSTFYMHYRTQTSPWQMVRYFGLPVGATLKVGISAQSPQGEGGAFLFEALKLEQRTLAQPRKGL